MSRYSNEYESGDEALRWLSEDVAETADEEQYDLVEALNAMASLLGQVLQQGRASLGMESADVEGSPTDYKETFRRLNGLSMEYLLRELEKLGDYERKLLFDNFNQAAEFNQPRLLLAMNAVEMNAKALYMLDIYEVRVRNKMKEISLPVNQQAEVMKYVQGIAATIKERLK